MEIGSYDSLYNQSIAFHVKAGHTPFCLGIERAESFVVAVNAIGMTSPEVDWMPITTVTDNFCSIRSPVCKNLLLQVQSI